jgi:long-subunit acyl-CoA synthetase (AMP-forming)
MGVLVMFYGPGAGYVGDAEASCATLVADGWLRTGDLCYIDKEGFLFVADG